MEERLQKILARCAGVSRRKAEELIADGRVRVNGKTVRLGEQADGEEDVIELDGVLFPVSKSLRDDALILTFSTEKADAALSLLLNCPRSRHSRYSRALISLAKSMFSIRYHLIYAP